jgi:hypothetical protein
MVKYKTPAICCFYVQTITGGVKEDKEHSAWDHNVPVNLQYICTGNLQYQDQKPTNKGQEMVKTQSELTYCNVGRDSEVTWL